MRSALTVLGVVIGITSIVGMTSLIRGFDNSLRDSISQLGPNTIMIQKWGALSLSGRARASSTSHAPEPDAGGCARRSSATARRSRWSTCGSARRATRSRASTTATRRPRRSPIIGATENWAAVNFAKLEMGRLFIPCGGRTSPAGRGARAARPGSRCSRTSIPIGKIGADRRQRVHGDRRARQTPEPGRLFDRRRRLRRHPVQYAREVLRQGAQGIGEDLRQQFQSGGVPHRDDRGRPARRHARARRCARSRR